jgi:hypothetical protein
MKFEIVGLEEVYGKHRYSNNEILECLQEKVEPSADLMFVWWVEKMFLDPKYEDIVERLCNTEWFGVMHVPLLTPNWGLYSQNNLAKLYFMRVWRQALKRCKAIITLSEHMRDQVSAIYPDLRVFTLKHPIPAGKASFDFERFSRDPTLLMVGTWLRDFDSFFRIETKWRKRVILNHYAEEFIGKRYQKYRPGMLRDIKSLDYVEFLDSDDYDSMLSASVPYLYMHETSANNAVCECISYSVPFVANRHPAIVEYCGSEYPMFVSNRRRLIVSLSQVADAHAYLRERNELREELSMGKFVVGMADIWARL